MIFERTKGGEILALARLLNISTEMMMSYARSYQPEITDLEQVTDATYGKLMDLLLFLAQADAERCEGGDEDEAEDMDEEKEDEERWYWAERQAEEQDDAYRVYSGYYERMEKE